MDKLIFATNNANKVEEINSLTKNVCTVISLKEAGIDIEIPEPHNTLEENATEKSLTIWRLTNQNCFSEDTGLEVDALNGEPGVRSARYAGEGKGFKENITKLLLHLSNKQDRTAQFKTVISLILEGVEHHFTGICKGQITLTERGENGFGYDAVFIPDGSEKTFAEMNLDEKNVFSHRKKATAQLLSFLSRSGNNPSV